MSNGAARSAAAHGQRIANRSIGTTLGPGMTLGEISAGLQRRLESLRLTEERRKQRLIEARTYSAPEDDIVEIGSAYNTRRRGTI